MCPTPVRVLTVLAMGVCVAASSGSSPPAFVAFGNATTLEISGAETHGATATLRIEVLPGNGPAAHIHTREDETYIVTRGRFRFAHGKQIVDATPGTVLYLPRNQAHQWLNVGPAPGELILTVAPAGLEQFFLQAGRRHLARPKDQSEIIRLAAEYGIRYVQPLIAQRAKP